MGAYTIAWLAAAVIFCGVEIATLTLCSVWFATGSLAAAIAAALGADLMVQLILFSLVSLALLAALRPLVRKYIRPRIQATNAAALVGQIGIVTADIDNIAAQGQVKISGMEWAARCTGGQPVPAGTKVRVDGIEGVKLFVPPAEH